MIQPQKIIKTKPSQIIEHKCEICHKKYKHIKSYDRHMKMHSGDGKKYNCSHCDKKFTQKCHLKTHELIHTGEKPFSCKWCNFKCNQKNNLEKHEMTKHEDKLHEISHSHNSFIGICDLRSNSL